MHFNKFFSIIPFLQYINANKKHIAFIVSAIIIVCMLISKFFTHDIAAPAVIKSASVNKEIDHTYHFTSIPAHLHDPFNLPQNEPIPKEAVNNNLPAAMPADKNISSIKTNIHLVGIINNKNKSIAIFSQNKKFFSVKVGEQLFDFIITDIGNNTVRTKSNTNHSKIWHINDF